MIDKEGKFERHDLRLLYCPGMVAAGCLIVLFLRVQGFIASFDSFGIPTRRDGIEWFPYFVEGLLLAVAAIPVVLIAAAINVTLHGNSTTRIQILIYLLFMFAAIVLDFILIFLLDIAVWMSYPK